MNNSTVFIPYSGEDWAADIQIHYSEGDDLEIEYAQIIDKFGKVVRKIKKKDITFQSAVSRIAFYEDDYVKEFSLKWNDYPYQIKYKYKKKNITNYISIANWYPIMDSRIPTLNASLKVELPLNYDVKVYHSDAIDYKVVKQELVTHYFNIKDIEAFEKENYSPPMRELIPMVKITPKDFHYDKDGSSESWAAFGTWQNAVNEGLDELTSAEKVQVLNLTEGLTDTKEIVKVLYKHLQKNTRYVYVATDVGGLKPFPASYVCDKKYGDCKALTIYMKAMLKYKEIPSYYTKVYAGDNPVRINEDYPSQQFNHVFLCVPNKGDTIWIENTSDYAPLDYMGTFTQGRKGLFVDGSNSKLIDIPALGLSQVEEVYNYDVILNEEGIGQVKLQFDAKGAIFEEYAYVKDEFWTTPKKLDSKLS